MAKRNPRHESLPSRESLTEVADYLDAQRNTVPFWVDVWMRAMSLKLRDWAQVAEPRQRTVRARVVTPPGAEEHFARALDKAAKR